MLFKKDLHNTIICHSEWSESCPDRFWGGGMKNLRAGNYTEFRNISDGFPPSPWRTQYDNFRFCKGYYKSIQKILIAVLLSAVSIFSQSVSSVIPSDSGMVIGIIRYGGYSLLVTSKGIKPYEKKSSDEKFSEYYKSIYGKDAENPNHIIETNNGFSFIPVLSENQLRGYGLDSVDGFSIDDFYNFSETSRSKSGSGDKSKIKKRIINYIKELHENIKK